MPIKYSFVFKTVVRASDNVTVPTEITNDLEGLKKKAFSSTTTSDASFTIVIQKENGVVSDGGIDIEGKLSDSEMLVAKNIHALSLKAVTDNGKNNGKIKTVFVFKM